MRASNRALRPLVLGALLIAALTFYVWTAKTSIELEFYGPRIDPYNLMAQGFLDGRLDLPIEPKGLDDLADPYDPAAREPLKLGSDYHDLSLFEGKLYAYWGPVPALVLHVPLRILGFDGLSPGVAVLVFAFAALLLWLALMVWVVNRFLPRTPTWMLGVAGTVLAVGDAAPYLLRRPAQYEIALSAGQAFLAGGLLLLVTGCLGDRPRWGRIAGASLCFGLALGSRPPTAIGIVAATAILAWWWGSGRLPETRERLRAAACLLGPFALSALACAVYNYARFGSPAEFGQTFQLAAGKVSELNTYNPLYLLPGGYYYLLAPVKWRLEFPFAFLPPPPAFWGPTPSDWGTAEPTGGVFANLPFLWLLATAPFALRDRAATLRIIVWGSAGLGFALLVFVAIALPATTQRYEMDFSALLIVAASLSWFALNKRGRPRRLVPIAATVLAGYGIAVSILLSFTGEKSELRARHPDTAAAIERFLSPLPTLATQLAGRPMIASVRGDANVGGYGILSLEGIDFALDVDPVGVPFKVVSPHAGVVTIRARMVRGPEAPASAVTPFLEANGATATGTVVEGSTQEFSLPVRRGINVITAKIDLQPFFPYPLDDSRSDRVAFLEDLGVEQG